MKVETLKQLVENYKHLEEILVEELNIDAASAESSAEEIWQPIFKRIVPTKYNVATNVYIIDSSEHISEKVSIAIYDEQYTPYIFNYGMIKYIPIEAVFAVVLCKGESSKLDVEKWLEKIKELKTEANAYVRIQFTLLDTKDSSARSTQTATRPITIACVNEAVEGFDITLSRSDNKLNKVIAYEDKSLSYWHRMLNHVGESKGKTNEKQTERTLKALRVYDGTEEQVLMSLMFQLNQLLMLINNPMFFPHASYAKMFRGETK
ncbi:DUF6602 domain-containing protein [Metalysinibacillus jejuensis]|uniref:DUF6602 domain-containing protein n=1 Tax=Metalysinibacillus jejuensis TaxID=914327 RepID=UPI000D34BAF3|nr:DUF6602 domain-containing protein [Metalysinibacillus jejuensis]